MIVVLLVGVEFAPSVNKPTSWIVVDLEQLMETAPQTLNAFLVLMASLRLVARSLVPQSPSLPNLPSSPPPHRCDSLKWGLNRWGLNR